MESIAGITTQKNAQGDITYVTIDVQKHRDVITPLLKQLGLIEKTEFQKECEGGLTVSEARESSLKFIEEIWRK